MIRNSKFIILFGVIVVILSALYVLKYQRTRLASILFPKSPQTVEIDAEELADALLNGPWVSPGLKGRILYKVGYRSCPDCIAYERSEFAALHNAGVDTRVLLFARRKSSTAEERAVIAELACTRNWQIYTRWMEDVEQAYYYHYGIPPAPDTDPKRAACLEWGRTASDRVEAVLINNGRAMETPALFWQNDDGKWRFFLGNTDRGKRMIRRELSVPLQ
jgi:hypothetical protein